MLKFQKIEHRIISAVGFVVVLGLATMVLFYANKQEKSILAQNERAVHRIIVSVSHTLQTIMLAGYADIARAFADSLKTVPDVVDFRIIRLDGSEAFRDNKTISGVNERRGEEGFFPRQEGAVIPVLSQENAALAKALKQLKITHYYETTAGGERLLTFLSPILNRKPCQACHGTDSKVRGILKLTSSLNPIEKVIKETWRQSLWILAISTFVILLVTSVMIRRTIVTPIIQVTNAMKSASTGNLERPVPVFGQDELSTMALSFNKMTSELLTTHTGLHQEQNKLTTIILSAREGIVVTDENGDVVLVNPAAEFLLGKTADVIKSAGFEMLFDDAALMRHWIKRAQETEEPNHYEFKEHKLSVAVASINAGDGERVGSSALIRDVTVQEKLEDELRTLANTDGLTGLFNRRFMDETLAAELTRARRYGLDLSVLMFDVDHFKIFNDTHGHDQGDRVLQSLAATMRAAVRNVDFPCRFGGEEFFIIMPNTSAEGTLELAERLRQDVENTVVDGLNVTISIGVASLNMHAPKDAEHFVTIADAALYGAKKSGRNKVVLAEKPDAA